MFGLLSPNIPGTSSLFDVSLKETQPKCILTKDGFWDPVHTLPLIAPLALKD